MRYVYREVDGKVQAQLVSNKTRIPNRTNDLWGEGVPFHKCMLNAYADLEAKGEYNKPARVKTYVRDVHQQALDEGR